MIFKINKDALSAAIEKVEAAKEAEAYEMAEAAEGAAASATSKPEAAATSSVKDSKIVFRAPLESTGGEEDYVLEGRVQRRGRESKDEALLKESDEPLRRPDEPFRDPDEPFRGSSDGIRYFEVPQRTDSATSSMWVDSTPSDRDEDVEMEDVEDRVQSLKQRLMEEEEELVQEEMDVKWRQSKKPVPIIAVEAASEEDVEDAAAAAADEEESTTDSKKQKKSSKSKSKSPSPMRGRSPKSLGKGVYEMRISNKPPLSRDTHLV